jgi:hypothetical protein
MAFSRTYWTLLLQRAVVDDDGEAGDYSIRALNARVLLVKVDTSRGYNFFNT